MAIRDDYMTFSKEQAETTVAAHDSTNHVDLGALVDFYGTAIGENLGAAKQLILHGKVTEAVTSGGAATVQFELQDSADDSSFAALTPIPFNTGALAKAALVKGYKFFELPLPVYTIRRYLKVIYTIGTAALTAGKFSCWLDFGPDARG